MAGSVFVSVFSHCNHYSVSAIGCQYLFQNFFEKVQLLFGRLSPYPFMGDCPSCEVLPVGGVANRQWLRTFVEVILENSLSYCNHYSRLSAICQPLF